MEVDGILAELIVSSWSHDAENPHASQEWASFMLGFPEGILLKLPRGRGVPEKLHSELGSWLQQLHRQSVHLGGPCFPAPWPP